MTTTASERPFTVRSLLGPLMAVVLGMIMVILDSTVVNVALPTLVDYFRTTETVMQWSITAYTLALSAVIPLAGWVIDRFGAKRVFLVTIGLFTIGSVLCSLAQTPEQLIVYRVIQGLGGGMVSPIGMAIVFRLAPPGKTGAVMGTLGIPMMLGPASGPILSGWLVEYVSWHWIFLINLPIGIIAILVGLKYLPNLERKEVPALDFLGMFLAPVAFAMLAYGVNEGGTDWSSPRTITGLAVGGAALLVFIAVELRHRQPLLELRAFGSTDFTRGILASWLMQIALFGSFLFIPLYLQYIKQYGPLESGLILLPQVFASGILMPISGRLYDKLGARPLVMTGLAVIAAGLYLFSRVGPDTPLGYILVSLFVLGAGMGMSMMPLNTHVLQAAPRHLVNRVTPLTTAAQQVMVSFAVAGLTGYWTSRQTDYMAEPGTVPGAAMAEAFGDTFLLAACIAAAGFLLALALRKPKQKAEPNPEGTNEGASEDANPSMMMGH